MAEEILRRQMDDSFAASLPPAADAATSAVPPTRPACFIVDDEPGIRQFIAYSLRDFDISAHEYDSAPAVLDAVKQQMPNLLFLDVSLRGSDAVDVLRGLAAHQYRGAVLLISGRDPSLLEEIRRIGERHALRMLPALHKPFRAEVVRGIVRQHLGEHLEQTQRADQPAPNGQPAPMVSIGLGEILQNNWLELWYQPKIELKRRCLVGMEGLARARHPEYGVLPPAAFLPQATEDEILQLTEAVFVAAFADWERFAEHGFSVRIALNVPVSALVKLPIANLVRELRPKSDLWPGLVLEVTEDQIVRDITLAQEIATQLKIYNIALAIDDFGTGYSHLARLRDLPFAELKLDRNLVLNCGDDETNAALCQTGIDLAHRFGSVAVAEGIEKPTELHALLAMGCDLGQGYLFAPPMPTDRFIDLLCHRTRNRPHTLAINGAA